jgi:hypothetical protein
VPSEINQTTIVNRGLQILGYRPVGGIQSNDRGARAMNTAYKPVLFSMLEENYWAFATKRASIAADTNKPLHTYKSQFRIPGDFIMLAPPDQLSEFPDSKNFIREGDFFLSNDAGPLNIRYVSNSVTESQFPALFAEAFSAQLAVMTCEELTQSSGKIKNASVIYERQIDMAKKRNFILIEKPRAPKSIWLSARD